MRDQLRRAAAVLAVALLGAVWAPGTAAKASTTISNTVTPQDFIVYFDCAGEEIHFVGDFHVVTRVTVDASGATHIAQHMNNQGMRGTGLTTGSQYSLSNSHTLQLALLTPPPFVFTHVFTTTVIGQGGATNQLLHIGQHTTINANGDATSTVNSINADCR